MSSPVHKITSGALLLGVCVATMSATAQPKFRLLHITDEQFSVSDFNNKAEMVGSHANAAGIPTAVVWSHGVLRELPPLPDSTEGYCEALGMNDVGDVVGVGSNQTGWFSGLLWHDGHVSDLHVGPQANNQVFAQRVDNAGHIVGFSDQPQATLGFLKQGSQLTTLAPPPGFADTIPNAVNRFGAVAGYTLSPWDGVSQQVRAAIWWQGHPIDPGTLPGTTQSTAWSINDRMQVTGYSYGDDFVLQGWIWEWGHLQPLSERCGTSEPIIGGRISPSGLSLTSAGLCDIEHGATYPYESLVRQSDPLRPYVQLTQFSFINDADQILAKGTDSRNPGVQGFYLLTRVN